MFEIVPRVKSSGDRFAEAFANMGQSASQLIPEHFLQKQERKAVGDLIGQDLSHIRDPNLLNQIMQHGLKNKSNPNDFQADQENYEKIKDAFGENFAKVWGTVGQGERTQLIKTGLEAKARGIDIDKMLGSIEGQSTGGQAPTSQGEYQLNTEGMTPKEVQDFKMNLRKENAPVWKEAVDKRKASRELGTDIKILRKLNEKGNLPKKFSKLLINPETGAPYELVSAVKDMHPDIQQWVKTIARQAGLAKNDYPGRVTNFDLSTYMRKFPSLFNTKEGRDVILEQMDLTNQAQDIMADAVANIYKKHRLSGITPEDAHEMAYESVKGKLEEIDQKLMDLASRGESMASQEEEGSAKKQRTMDVIGPDGSLYEIDENEVSMLPEGFRLK